MMLRLYFVLAVNISSRSFLVIIAFIRLFDALSISAISINVRFYALCRFYGHVGSLSSIGSLIITFLSLFHSIACNAQFR